MDHVVLQPSSKKNECEAVGERRSALKRCFVLRSHVYSGVRDQTLTQLDYPNSEFSFSSDLGVVQEPVVAYIFELRGRDYDHSPVASNQVDIPRDRLDDPRYSPEKIGMPRHFRAGAKALRLEVMVEPGRESQRQRFESR